MEKQEVEGDVLFMGVVDMKGELLLMVSPGVFIRMKKGFWMALLSNFEHVALEPDEAEYKQGLARTIDRMKKALEDWKD